MSSATDMVGVSHAAYTAHGLVLLRKESLLSFQSLILVAVSWEGRERACPSMEIYTL